MSENGQDVPRLTGKQKRFLRALGTAYDPVVQIGKTGVTESSFHTLEEALAARELVKVRVLKNCSGNPKDIAGELAEATSSHKVQVVGRNILLYRPSEKEPVIVLPE